MPKSLAAALLLSLLAAGCASSKNDSDREWQRGQCDRVVDPEDRTKCLKRVDDEYGSRSRDAEPAAPKR